jgi:hypothetical protein
MSSYKFSPATQPHLARTSSHQDRVINPASTLFTPKSPRNSAVSCQQDPGLSCPFWSRHQVWHCGLRYPVEVSREELRVCDKTFTGKNPRSCLWHHLKWYATCGLPERAAFANAHGVVHEQMKRAAGKSYSHTPS